MIENITVTEDHYVLLELDLSLTENPGYVDNSTLFYEDGCMVKLVRRAGQIYVLILKDGNNIWRLPRINDWIKNQFGGFLPVEIITMLEKHKLLQELSR